MGDRDVSFFLVLARIDNFNFARLVKQAIQKFLCEKFGIIIFSFYFCNVLSNMLKARGQSSEEGMHTYKRRFLNALVLTCWNLANSNCLSRTKQRERPLEVYYIMSINDWWYHNTYTSAWGFQRCSFRQIGRCESFYIADLAQNWLHVFCVHGRTYNYN